MTYIWVLNQKIGDFPPKWMVKIMEKPIQMDDLGVKPTIFGNIHIYITNICMDILKRTHNIDISYAVAFRVW